MVPARADGVHPYIRRERKIDEPTKGRKNVREADRKKKPQTVGGCSKDHSFYNYTSFTEQDCTCSREDGICFITF